MRKNKGLQIIRSRSVDGRAIIEVGVSEDDWEAMDLDENYWKESADDLEEFLRENLAE
jgi:hypothetical protein